jgi:hypothetical protein
MHCWFCESPLRSAGPGEIYCPFAACPACKDKAPAYTLLDGRETALWRAMREGGSLETSLRDAGLIAAHDGFIVAPAGENVQDEQFAGRQLIGDDDAPP